MKDAVIRWIKGQLGLIIDDTEMTSYWTLKVDYLSSMVQELQKENKKLLADVYRLEQRIEDVLEKVVENEDEISDLENKHDNLKYEFEEANVGYMWEKIDELDRNFSDLEIPLESDIREVFYNEWEAIRNKGAQSIEDEINTENELSTERVITGIVRSEIAEYNEYMAKAIGVFQEYLSDKSLD